MADQMSKTWVLCIQIQHTCTWRTESNSFSRVFVDLEAVRRTFWWQGYSRVSVCWLVILLRQVEAADKTYPCSFMWQKVQETICVPCMPDQMSYSALMRAESNSQLELECARHICSSALTVLFSQHSMRWHFTTHHEMVLYTNTCKGHVPSSDKKY